MRKLKELYELVLKSIEKRYQLGELAFICTTIEKLEADNKITPQEKKLLMTHLSEKRPKKGSQFFKHHTYFKESSENGPWWYPSKEGNEQRILFIKELIKTQ